MLIVDIIAGAIVLLLAVWGMRAGLGGTLAPAVFAAGALVGAIFGPKVLGVSRVDEFALVIAYPAGLLLGGLLAAVVERRTLRLRRRFDRLDRLRGPSSLGGALLAVWIGAVFVWLVGAGVAQVKTLRNPVEKSTIVAQLDDFVKPPGPEKARTDVPFDAFPTIAGPGPPILPTDPALEKDPQVLKADRSVVQILTRGCRTIGFGSGWVGKDGIVVTNAHVTTESEEVRVLLRGKGKPHPATVIWIDRRNDISLLRVPELRGVPALKIVARPKRETLGAALGFPALKHDIRAARIGRTTTTIGGEMFNTPRGFPRKLSGRLVTPFRGTSEPGSSGGPVVDGKGHVLTTVFGGGATGSGESAGYGVPNRFTIDALKRAGPKVDTGDC